MFESGFFGMCQSCRWKRQYFFGRANEYKTSIGYWTKMNVSTFIMQMLVLVTFENLWIPLTTQNAINVKGTQSEENHYFYTTDMFAFKPIDCPNKHRKYHSKNMMITP